MPVLSYRPDIAFGVAATDIVSGYTGRITAITRRITGADEVLLETWGAQQPAGSPPTSAWFAVQRVRVRLDLAAAQPIPGPVPGFVQDINIPPAPPAGGPGRAGGMA